MREEDDKERTPCRTLSMSISVIRRQEQQPAACPLEQPPHTLGTADSSNRGRLEEENVPSQDILGKKSEMKQALRAEWKILQATVETWEEPDFSTKTKNFKITKVIWNVVFALRVSFIPALLLASEEHF